MVASTPPPSFSVRHRLLSALRRWQPGSVSAQLVFAFALALLVFGLTLDFAVLNPTRINWCLSSDSDVTIYFFSFAYYRFSPWGLPITNIDTLFHPVGSSLIVMDGLPLVAVPLKLFAKLLPIRFQFLGAWLFICIWLQGFFAQRLLRVLKLPTTWCWVGAVLAVSAPPFIGRFGHVALSSHWLLLLAMAAAAQERPGLWLSLVPALALWVHPYLFAMVLALSGCGQLRFVRVPGAALRLFWTLLTVFGSLWLLGYFQMHETRNKGFEIYSSDLSSLFNSMGTSRLLPGRKLGTDAWEGSAYLGLGGILLGLALVASWVVPRLRKNVPQNYWLLAACLAMAVYSLGTAPHFLGNQLFRLERVAALIEPISARFRTSGRFVWPLYYYVLCFGLGALRQLISRPKWQTWSAPALLAVQLVDIVPGLLDRSARPEFEVARSVVPRVPKELEPQLTPQTRLLLFMPPVKAACGKHKWRGSYQEFAWFGALHHLTTNANLGEGRSSRSDKAAVCNYTKKMFRHPNEHEEAIFVEP